MTRFSHPKFTFVAIFLLSIYHITNAQFLYQHCYKTYGEYSSLSDYGTNIDEAITQLTTLASTSYYNTVSVGKGNDKVNALYYCRYDMTSDECKSCIESTLDRVPDCLRSVESIQFSQECTLHYSNYTILNIMEDAPQYYIHGLEIINDTEFTTLLSETVTSLISDTVAEFAVSSRYFATSKTKYSITKSIYALAQCTENLSTIQCNACLENGFSNFTASYPGAFMGQIFMPSCRLSYMLTTLLTSPYDFSVKLLPSTPQIPPLSSPDEDSPPPPSDDEELSPPPPSSIFDKEPSSPTYFLDEAPPPPSRSLPMSTGTRGMSATVVSSFFIVLIYFGLLI